MLLIDLAVQLRQAIEFVRLGTSRPAMSGEGLPDLDSE